MLRAAVMLCLAFPSERPFGCKNHPPALNAEEKKEEGLANASPGTPCLRRHLPSPMNMAKTATFGTVEVVKNPAGSCEPLLGARIVAFSVWRDI